jgi:hypothetical protein
MTTSASTGSDGYNVPVRARQQAAEDAAKEPQRTQPEISDYERDYNERQAEKAAKLQRDIAAGRLVQK